MSLLLNSTDERMINKYEEAGGMRIGSGNRSIRRKPAPVPLCPPQNPYDLSWGQTRATTVGSWKPMKVTTGLSQTTIFIWKPLTYMMKCSKNQLPLTTKNNFHFRTDHPQKL
jgi:hypothetical protein